MHRNHARSWGQTLAVTVAGWFLAAPAGAFAQTTAPTPEPVLLRHPINKLEWTLNAEVTLHGNQYRAIEDRDIKATTPIEVDGAVIVFPVPTDSGYHRVKFSRVTGNVKANGRLLDGTPRFTSGYQAGNRLAVFDLPGFRSTTLRMEVAVPMTSFETRIDEDRAFDIRWPDEDWPEEIAGCLQPQMFVESDEPVVRDLVREWTNGNPRKAQPYYLAKYLAGKVVEHYQPTDTPFTATGRQIAVGVINSVLITGYNIQGAAFAAAEGRGAPFDMPNLLCAVYRAAGIPARVVVGFDAEGQRRPQEGTAHAWVEFYLWHEASQFGEWIPVDILEQRAFSSRMPPIEQRWQFFGHNEESEFYCPISYHWHPPTAVVNSGPPALWGWLPEPAAPLVDQQLRFFAFQTPIRGDDPPIEELYETPP